MDWIVLCLLAPLVLVPVVMLWGFAGCGAFGASEGSGTTGTFSVVVDADGDGAVKITAQFVPVDTVRLVTMRKAVADATPGEQVSEQLFPFFPVVDRNRPELVTYFYYMKAVNSAGTEKLTAEVSFRLLPFAPTDLRPSTVGVNSVQLTWTNRSTGASHVVIKQTDIATGVESEQEKALPGSSIDVVGLKSNAEYSFQIAARLKASGNTLASAFTPVAPLKVRTLNPAVATPLPTYTGLDLAAVQTFPNLGGGTVVVRISKDLLTRSSTTGRTIITLRGAPGGPITFKTITISEPAATGNLYDSGPNLKVVSTAEVRLEVNQSRDFPVDYSLNEGVDLLVAMDLKADGTGNIAYNPQTGTVSCYLPNAEQAQPQVDPAGNYARGAGYDVTQGRVAIIEKIQVV